MTRHQIILLVAGFILLTSFLSVNAQSGIESAIDSLSLRIQSLEKKGKLQENLKITGYLQPQFQLQQTSDTEDSNFSLRRGRLKVEYKGGTADYVIQIDATEKGLALKDGFVKLYNPWVKSLSLTAGVFHHMFGFEGPYSSANMESPERAMVYTSTFADNRDIGVGITFRPDKDSRFNFLRIDAGLYNGTGKTDYDRFKDFIGSIGANSSLVDGLVDYSLKVSYLNGGRSNSTKYIYTMGTLADGNPSFVVDSTESNLNARAAMNSLGANLELGLNLPIGKTIFRGEYFQGLQPGLKTATRTPRDKPNNTADTYIRNYQGAIFYLIQNFAKTGHQAVVKYDFFDPNIDASADEIGRNDSGLSKTDIFYSTLGFGWVYDASSKYRIVVFYEIPTNETSENLEDFEKDQRDNLLTVRLQYRF